MPPPIAFENQQRLEGFHDFVPSTKLHVKKPKAKPEAGMRNWFDGLEDEGGASDEHPDAESEYPMQEPHKSPLTVQEMMLPGGPSQQVPERNRSFSTNSEPTSLSERKSRFRFESPPVRGLSNRSSSQALEGMSASGSTHGSLGPTIVQTMTSSRGPRSGANLHFVSFLELSSSDEETESNSDAPYRSHRIRASIERASYNSEVSVRNAQRAQPIRPRSVVNGRARPLSRRPSSSENVPPVPKITVKPKVSQRSSSVRWREVMEDKARSTECTIDSRESSLSGSIGAQRATKVKQNIRRSRFMKVTSEEEKLLEAMREKRASIRQDDFDKGFKTAMQLQDIVARPRTAGADGRASQSPNFGSRSSKSLPPQEHAIKSSRRISGFSASAEDLRLEDAYPFPEVPLNRKGQISPPKPSPSLSFSPSDILPETPASHNSPMTPPPGHGGMGAYGRSLTLSPPRGITALPKTSHGRKRTVSSSVVDIGGVEQQAQVMDEDGLSRWGMDRW